MNWSDASSKQTARTTQLHPADTRLHGRWLVLAWLLSLTLCGLSVGLFVADIPSFNANLHLLCTGTVAACYAHGQLAPSDVQRLHELGLAKDFFAVYLIVLTSVFALGNWLVAGFLFWRRSDDRLALLAAGALGMFPIVFNSPLSNALAPPWWFLVLCIRFLGTLCLGLFFYLFPGGRFAPRWIRWLFVVALLYSVLSTFFPSAAFNPFSTFPVLGELVLLGLIGSIVAVQIYRYLRVSSPEERQQTKWVVYGASLGWGGYLVIFTLSAVFPALFQTGSLVSLIEGLAVYGLLLLVPLSFGFAILRSRLWEIDVLINRTLVYGMLTGILALAYVGLVVGLSALLRGITSQDNSLAIVLSTLAVAALCQPLRSRLRQGIDRRFYRRKYNAARTLAAFSVTLRHEVEQDQVSEALLAVVAETMQPAHLSLWLRPAAAERPREQREQKQATVGHFSQNFPVDFAEVTTSHLEKE